MLLHYLLNVINNNYFFLYRGPWELEIPTNVVIYERSPSMMHQPHPNIELYRGNLVAKLRQCYQELCQSRESKCCLMKSFIVN